jgi:RNA polymerase sigma factor (sigma-70 family)
MTSASALTPALDDPTLLRALAGEPAALARLYVSHRPLVLRVARRILARRRLHDPASELAAEVWLRLLDHGCRPLRAFDPARGSFAAFMRMVAWQHARAIASRWQRLARCEPPHAPGHPLEPVAPCAITALHHRRLVGRVLADVGPQLSSLDLTLLEEGLLWQTPLTELSARLGLPTSALYSRRARLRARLRAAARRLDGEPLPCAA